MINNSDKKRIISFIKDNEIDFNIVDNEISRFHVISYDGKKFHFEKHNETWVLVKYDPKKDDIHNAGSMPFEYFQYETLPQLLEQLLHHDKSISKSYWNLIMDSIEIGLGRNYLENWYEDIVVNDFWKVEDNDNYKWISYTNENYKPELKSPFNTIHEISPINDLKYETVNKLYFEIHPVSCLEGSESYLLKLLCNNEEVFKEYINYSVFKKKGLKLFLETIFRDMDRFKGEC